MSEQKNYILTKTKIGDILFELHPISNYGLTRRVYLTDNNPKIALPRDWALGVFQNDGVYQMYKQGCFTFDDNEGIAKEAFEAGVYFDDELDFQPATVNTNQEVLDILKTGVRAEIVKAVDKYGKERVISVASENSANLTQGVLSVLEKTLNVQLILDEN